MAEKDGNSVFIGRKPITNYVLACITLFHSGSNEVCIKSRGRAVTRAVDVADKRTAALGGNATWRRHFATSV